MNKEMILKEEDLYTMLDTLLRENSRFNWDEFYKNRSKGIPFFVNKPDETIEAYFKADFFRVGKVLELGCGPGRNALYFAQKGCAVDAVDLSREAIEWGKERAKEQKADVHFIHGNLFDLNLEEASYDIIYDSGCFHHIPPHRRPGYINLLRKALKPGGTFGITCFVEDGEYGGAAISDWEVYRTYSLRGGLGFTPEKLKMIFHDFKPLEIRRMRETKPEEEWFGLSDLLAGLFKKPE